MRNLSKVLALVLSLAFVLTMFASAAFIVPVGDKVAYTDTEEFDSDAGKEAVRVLTALKVVKGYPAGDFRPDGDVTRAEYAKMIALAKTGAQIDDDADFTNWYTTDVVLPFTDVADGDWFKGYVNYAYMMYILAGYGDGTLRPANNVTGVEALKMTLVALGYDPKIEGLEGADWMRNTMSLVEKTGLLDNLKKENMYAALDREATAILVWNALNEKMVEYNNGFRKTTDRTLADVSDYKGIELAKSVKASDVKITDDGTYFIDGDPATAAEAQKVLDKAKGSTAPVEKLGDAIYLYNYDVYKVKAVDGNKLTLWGKGDVTVVDAADIAADDYVVIWQKTLGNGKNVYAKELDVINGKVSAYTVNSNDGFGIGITEAGGKYTINGKQYTFGALSKDFDNAAKGLQDESDYFAQLLSEGSAAVADANLTFIVDGDFIVAVFVNENTYWENYAIVIGYNEDDQTLSMQHVRLLTDDNEYKDFYVATLNGNQKYNQIVSGTTAAANTLPECNTLVRYEELGDNKIALYTLDYANAVSNVLNYDSTGRPAKNDFNGIEFDWTDNWIGYGIKDEHYPQSETMFTWENGVVFVTYEQDIDEDFIYVDYGYDFDYDDEAYLWRAYRYGEFQPNGGDPCWNAVYNDFATVVCANSLNNNITLKAAAIAFYSDADDYTLPNLPLRAGQVWGTVMSVTDISANVDDAVAKYAYKFNILKPWSTETESITVYDNFKLATPSKGDICKLYLNEDGICRRFEIAANEFDTNNVWYSLLGSLLDDHDYDGYEEYLGGNGYFELCGWNVSNATWDTADNGWWLTLNHPFVSEEVGFVVETEKFFLPAEADAYFVKNLFSTDISAIDYVKEVGKYGLNSLINDKKWVVYADVDMRTDEIQSIWFNQEKDNAQTKFSWFAPIKVAYNYGTETVTYILNPGDMSKFDDGTKTLVEKNVKPYEVKAPITHIDKGIGGMEPIGDDDDSTTFALLTATQYENGGWYVTDIGGWKWKCFDKTKEGNLVFGDTLKLVIEAHANGSPLANYMNGVKFYDEATSASYNLPYELEPDLPKFFDDTVYFASAIGDGPYDPNDVYFTWYREDKKHSNLFNLSGAVAASDEADDDGAVDSLISCNYNGGTDTAYNYEQFYAMVIDVDAILEYADITDEIIDDLKDYAKENIESICEYISHMPDVETEWVEEYVEEHYDEILEFIDELDVRESLDLIAGAFGFQFVLVDTSTGDVPWGKFPYTPAPYNS